MKFCHLKLVKFFQNDLATPRNNFRTHRLRNVDLERLLCSFLEIFLYLFEFFFLSSALKRPVWKSLHLNSFPKLTHPLTLLFPQINLSLIPMKPKQVCFDCEILNKKEERGRLDFHTSEFNTHKNFDVKPEKTFNSRRNDRVEKPHKTQSLSDKWAIRALFRK